jgi:hypothetical protein
MLTIDNSKASVWSPDDVTIPSSLFSAIISLLDDLDVHDYDSDIVQLYGYVIHSLNSIKGLLDFKQAFARFFYAADGLSSFSAHMNSEFFSNSDHSF